MRTTPLIGRKAWFGPRRLGWGLSPIAPEGWVTMLAGVAAAIGVAVWSGATWAAIPVIAAMIAVIFLKGTSPGGPREREELQSRRNPGEAGR